MRRHARLGRPHDEESGKIEYDHWTFLWKRGDAALYSSIIETLNCLRSRLRKLYTLLLKGFVETLPYFVRAMNLNYWHPHEVIGRYLPTAYDVAAGRKTCTVDDIRGAIKLAKEHVPDLKDGAGDDWLPPTEAFQEVRGALSAKAAAVLSGLNNAIFDAGLTTACREAALRAWGREQ